MPGKKDYWTNPRNDGKWAVIRTGSSRAASLHNTQDEAWKEARRLARGVGSEAFLKGKDGKIQARNSYGNDPYPPRG